MTKAIGIFFEIANVVFLIYCFSVQEIQPVNDVTFWFQAMLVVAIFGGAGLFFARVFPPVSSRKRFGPYGILKGEIETIATQSYISSGYYSRGSFNAKYIVMHTKVSQSDVEKALSELVSEGVLVAHTDRKVTLYCLPTSRQAQLIDRYDLEFQWHETSVNKTVSHPYCNEVARVRSQYKQPAKRKSLWF